MKWKHSDLYNHPLGRRPRSLSHSHSHSNFHAHALMNYAESKAECAHSAFACSHALHTHTDAARSRILLHTLSLSLSLGYACNVMFWLFGIKISSNALADSVYFCSVELQERVLFLLSVWFYFLIIIVIIIVLIIIIIIVKYLFRVRFGSLRFRLVFRFFCRSVNVLQIPSKTKT